MSKKKRLIICFIIWYVIIFVLHYTNWFEFDANRLSKIILIMTFVPPILFYIMTSKKVLEKKDSKKYKNIKVISQKYKELLCINDKYSFNNLENINRKIIEKEYSHKSYDRARASEIILYKIENNENNIRDFILNAYRNKNTYDRYLKEIAELNVKTKLEEIESIGLSKEKFDKLENQLIKKTIISKDVYDISVEVMVIYITQSGRKSYEKSRIVNYQELCNLYMQWRNGKKYEETSKRERRYMNDSLRYDVLKRDGFKCKICGLSSKDGAKLHVDHIKPVSKGGKTTLSNLQTLCDRCNKGKSNK